MFDLYRERWTEPVKVALRESVIHVPKTQRSSRQRELTPAPCPGTLMNDEVTVNDLEWCLNEMTNWNRIEPYVTYCPRCCLLSMKKLAQCDLLSTTHRRDSIGHRYAQCFRCNAGGPVMIMDLRSITRWGAPPEETDKTNGLDVDLMAVLPELSDHTGYSPPCTVLQRRRPAVAKDWNEHNSDEALAISNSVACEEAVVWAIKECDSRICGCTHVVFYGPKVFATSICTKFTSPLNREPLALWCMKKSKFVPPLFFIMLLRMHGIPLPRDLMHDKLPQIKLRDATCARLIAAIAEEHWVSRPCLKQSCPSVQDLVAKVARPTDARDDPIYGPVAPRIVRVDLDSDHDDSTPSDSIMESIEGAVPAVDPGGTNASMDTDSSDIDMGDSDPMSRYRKWDPAEAHAVVYSEGDVPAVEPGGTDATLDTMTDKHTKMLHANQRCADEIRHAMRNRQGESTNIVLDSMCAIIPDFIWPILENKAHTTDRYTLTWLPEKDSVSIFSTHRPGSKHWDILESFIGTLRQCQMLSVDLKKYVDKVELHKALPIIEHPRPGEVHAGYNTDFQTPFSNHGQRAGADQAHGYAKSVRKRSGCNDDWSGPPNGDDEGPPEHPGPGGERFWTSRLRHLVIAPCFTYRSNHSRETEWHDSFAADWRSKQYMDFLVESGEKKKIQAMVCWLMGSD